MTTATLETAEAGEKSSVRDRAVDTARQAAHVAHEVRLLKTRAADAVEDGVHAMKRQMVRSLRNLEDLRDSTTYRIKRAPLKTLGLAFSLGVLVGVGVGWVARRPACDEPR